MDAFIVIVALLFVLGLVFRIITAAGRPISTTRPRGTTQPPVRRGGRPLREASDDEIHRFPALRGRCHVIDGDTIVIKRQKIRLAGIDAPELDDPYGQKAKWAMVEICRNQEITVRLTGERSYDRLVGICFREDGRDIGAELVRRGLALDWPMFLGGRYRGCEPPGSRSRILRSRYAIRRGLGA